MTDPYDVPDLETSPDFDTASGSDIVMEPEAAGAWSPDSNVNGDWSTPDSSVDGGWSSPDSTASGDWSSDSSGDEVWSEPGSDWN